MKESEILLGFVFTNYNSSQDTKCAVESINKSEKSNNCKIVIVDNYSKPEDVEILKQIEREFSNVYLVLSKTNLGYFKGLNAGIKYIKDNFTPINYMVVGNNDLIFQQNFYDSVINNQQVFEKYPVISPDIVTKDGSHQNPHVIKKINSWREIIYDLYFVNYYVALLIKRIAKITHKFTDRNDEEQYMIAQEIYQGHGSCYILGPIFFKNFDELFAPTFLMGEEFFLSLQLHQKGMSVYYFPDITVIHSGNSSIGAVPSKKIWEISKKSHQEYRKYITWNKNLE